jgi:hypothetical protein
VGLGQRARVARDLLAPHTHVLQNTSQELWCVLFLRLLFDADLRNHDYVHRLRVQIFR